MLNPVLATMDKAFPTDGTIETTYAFYVKVQAEGGAAIYSTLMTLHVECAPLGLVYSENPLFLTQVDMFVMDQILDIYTILDPTIFPAYCLPKKHKLMQIKKDGTNNSTMITSAASCSGV